MIEPAIRPTINGRSSRPDWVGVAPFTSCRYSGNMLMAPNMPRPISTLATRPRLKVELLNSRIGISASSSIRRSTMMKAMMPTMATASRPTMRLEPQPQVLPCSATISNGTMPTINATAPHQSIWCSRRVNGMCSTLKTTPKAMMPIGTLIRNTQRQPVMPRIVLAPANRPPTSGPMTDAVPNTARK